MTSNTTKKEYNLEKRTLSFAKGIIRLCKQLPRNTINNELIRQIVRSGSSVGANYREANEAVSDKDFQHRIKISRKECKETTYWLDLLEENNPDFVTSIDALRCESFELRNIFSAILVKSK